MLAIYTSRGVTPEVNLRECILHMPPQSLNEAEPTLALKPRGDVTRSPKQWPHKWTCVRQKFIIKITRVGADPGRDRGAIGFVILNLSIFGPVYFFHNLNCLDLLGILFI